jgi:transcriptional regulator with XRE-family HTH domain
MSAQQLADRTVELGMPIPRSVLANLESGRRETVSAAEIVVLAAALNVAPVELLSPVGFDKQIEMLPGRMIDPLRALGWVCGELKFEAAGPVTTLRRPVAGEESAIYLMGYHGELIDRLHAQEAEAAKSAADAVTRPSDPRTRKEAAYRISMAEDWRKFIREPLLRTRAEMRRRGMILPPLPDSLNLDEEGAGVPVSRGDEEDASQRSVPRLCTPRFCVLASPSGL